MVTGKTNDYAGLGGTQTKESPRTELNQGASEPGEFNQVRPIRRKQDMKDE